MQFQSSLQLDLLAMIGYSFIHVPISICIQSRTQSSPAFWSAGGRQERLWGIPAVKQCKPLRSSQSKFSRVSPGAHPLTKNDMHGVEVYLVVKPE